MSTTQVTVRLLEKDYQISCPEEERAALMKSADYLSQKMQEIRESGRVVGLDRIAVMAALNLAHEYLQSQSEGAGMADNMLQRLKMVNDQVDNALVDDKKRLI
ncbi:MAG TPA: cell division protein ZapA [Gammaproteobacteria bacterium]|nr:cell division protein ZapA [Gammaproteobacteria bacterium]